MNAPSAGSPRSSRHHVRPGPLSDESFLLVTAQIRSEPAAIPFRLRAVGMLAPGPAPRRRRRMLEGTKGNIDPRTPTLYIGSKAQHRSISYTNRPNILHLCYAISAYLCRWWTTWPSAKLGCPGLLSEAGSLTSIHLATRIVFHAYTLKPKRTGPLCS
jgi:hypothetical protein